MAQKVCTVDEAAFLISNTAICRFDADIDGIQRQEVYRFSTDIDRWRTNEKKSENRPFLVCVCSYRRYLSITCNAYYEIWDVLKGNNPNTSEEYQITKQWTIEKNVQTFKSNAHFIKNPSNIVILFISNIWLLPLALQKLSSHFFAVLQPKTKIFNLKCVVWHFAYCIHRRNVSSVVCEKFIFCCLSF